MYESPPADALGKLILRLSIGVLVLLHGVHKLLDPGTLQFIMSKLSDADLPPLLAYGVYAGEVLGPVLVIVGLLTRFGALLIVVNMIFAIVLAHGAQLALLTDHGGWQLELQGLYLFGALAIMFMGGGRYALMRS